MQKDLENRKKEKTDGWFLRVLQWREKHIKEKTFILILALIVGVAGGFAALLLKDLIHHLSGLLTAHLEISNYNYNYLIYPVIGILLAGVFVRYIIRDNISHGVTRVLYALSQNKSRLKPHNIYSSVIASSVTIGFGGSVGAESPIVYTGAAIGSNLGSLFRLSPRLLMLLVGCGASAGIAGIFKAPIAGMLFTVEVLMIDLTAGSVMPLMIASIAGATVAYAFTGYELEFFFSQSEPFYTAGIPYVILFGIFCGLISLYFSKVMNMMERMFGKLKNAWIKFIVGSVILSTLIFMFPPLYGEGYNVMNIMLEGNLSQIFDGSIFYEYRNDTWWLIAFVGLILFTKAFATSATNGGGGCGGTFTPSLFIGCFAGFFFTLLLNNLGVIEGTLSMKNYALMGMAGVMSAVMNAPLMGIFLAAEMTGGYELFLPLLIVSTISYGTFKLFSPYSIYTQRLAQRGELLTHEKDRSVLTLLKMDSVIEKDFKEVHPDMTLREMCEVISQSSRNLYPVTDSNNVLVGVVLLDDIRNIMFRPDLYDKMRVRKFMSSMPAKIELGQSMDSVMKMFDDTKAWNLPVVERGKYVGFVSKSKIFNSYRRVLKHYTDE